MRLGSSIGVRLDPSTRHKIQEISDSTGISIGNLMRQALEAYIERIEKEGGVLVAYRPGVGKGTRGAKP